MYPSLYFIVYCLLTCALYCLKVGDSHPMGKESPTDSYRIGPESNRIGAETNRFKTYRILTCLNVRFFVLYHVRRIVMPIISSERWRFIFLLKRVSNWIVLVWAWIKSHQSWTESYLSVSDRYVANGIVFIVSYCLKDWDSPLVKKKKKGSSFLRTKTWTRNKKKSFGLVNLDALIRQTWGTPVTLFYLELGSWHLLHHQHRFNPELKNQSRQTPHPILRDPVWRGRKKLRRYELIHLNSKSTWCFFMKFICRWRPTKKTQKKNERMTITCRLHQPVW